MNDYELLMLIRENNEDANELLDNKYLKIIGSIIKQYNNKLKKCNITYKDMFSLCLEKYYYAKDNYLDSYEASFFTYVIDLINKTIKRSLIQNKKNLIIDYQPNENIIENSISIDKDPLNILLKEERAKDLSVIILTKLNKEQRKIIMYLFDNLSYQTIANKLNKSYRQIYWQVLKIRDILKECCLC